MNVMMSVSHRLFAAALAESDAGRRARTRSDRLPVIELDRPEIRSSMPLPRVPLPAATGRPAWFDSRLHA